MFLVDMERPAWRTLSVGARSLLWELRALYHGYNNGELYLSVREAARRLNADKSTVSRWFKELQDRGWIRPKVEAGFTWKTAARERMATCWMLTEFPTVGAAPTRDFTAWTGAAESIPRSHQTDSLSHQTDSLSENPDRPPKSVSPDGQNQPIRPLNPSDLSAHTDTDSYHGEGVSEPAEMLAAMQLARLRR